METKSQISPEAHAAAKIALQSKAGAFVLYGVVKTPDMGDVGELLYDRRAKPRIAAPPLLQAPPTLAHVCAPNGRGMLDKFPWE